MRGAEVYVRPDLRGMGPDIFAAASQDALLRETIVYLTCLHESGHALGLSHTADFPDIMYSFQYGGDIPEYFGRYRRKLRERADITKNSGISPQDRARFIQALK
jgi:predicted Zn-dependent protease